jgi:hypothetical protein
MMRTAWKREKKTMRWMRGMAAVLGLGLSGGVLAAACADDGPQYVVVHSPKVVPIPCSGVCEPRVMGDVDGKFVAAREPEIVWMGPPSEAPTCASVNMYKHYDFYMDWRGADGCPGCGCEPQHCELPDSLWYLDILPEFLEGGDYCAHGNSYGDVLRMPISWDGSCFAESLAPLVPATTAAVGPLHEPPVCFPDYVPADLDRFVGTLVRACGRTTSWETCPNPDGTAPFSCVQPAPEGFRFCQVFDTDRFEWEPKSCPVEYPERFDVAREITGCRRCECQATAPECDMTLSRYRDASCQDLVQTDVLDPSPDLPRQCFDLVGDGIVNSVSGTVVTKRDGTCEAFGGERQGLELGLDQGVMLCCQPVGG